MDIVKDQLNWAVFRPLNFGQKKTDPIESALKNKKLLFGCPGTNITCLTAGFKII
jgi:hypothetical protein